MSQPLPSPIVTAPGAGAIAAEHQLRQIIDNSNAVIYVKDLQGRYRLVNRAFENLFQLSAAQVLGQTDHQLFPESMAASLRANDLNVAHLGQSREFEEQLQVGERASTYLSSKFPLFDAEGRVTAVCGISTDISDREKVEDALRYVALGVSAATGTEVFEAIARYLARSLQADFAFVSRVSDEGPQRLTTLALYYNGKLHTNATYELAGTPCEQVFNRAFHFVGSDLQKLYPNDSVSKSLGVQSYAGYPLFASDGRPLGLIAAGRCSPLQEDRSRVESVLRIFSVRAAAELQRLDAEASYRAIFEASEDAIFVLDLHSGALVDVNPRACQAYGYSYEEMLSLGVDTFSAGYPPYTDVDAAGWLARAREGEPQRFEWHRRNRDGGLHWDEVFLKRATIGGIERILAFTREITQRKEAEQALRASEQQYRTIVSTALDCIIGMDSRGRITTFNPAAEQCFGYSREQALGQPWAELMIPERLRETYKKWLASHLQEGDGPLLGRRIELSAQRANAEEFPAELAISVVQGAEGPSFICYLRDITERKEAEEQRERLERQLRQAQRMEAIGHLTGGIAHDFNNLLTSMLGYTVMAEEHAERLGDERLGQYLGRVQRSAEKARDLIQQMLTFSRGSRGQPQPVALDSLIGDFIRLLESTLPATVEIDTQLSEGLPLVLVDPVQLEQVLMNLCINARDAMGSVGQLHIGLQRRAYPAAVCTSCQQAFAGDYLLLSVQDSGPGIDPAVQTRMFEPFFTTKALGQGSGMGLSMVHGIVHEYGGHILLQSAPGQGTGFQVLLPPMADTSSCSAEPHRLTDPDALLPPLSGRVVVVDDEPLVAEFMAERLAQWGAEVRVFSDAQEASALLLADPYAWDFVILDQSMPRLTGLQLARRLLAARADMPIALYSGFSDQLTETEVIAQGLKALLHKPLDQARLHALLRVHLPPA
ncbi:PAS domain S-box protein [Pseudomonas sp. 2FG]|uniref:PAS domain-containing hybrid sensor histidine kinase/response regulator n=1 Tax=Pseudomonas sp. 2FG TaxID=2502191 RepID=UPI0010F9AD3C|nr:PAS domain S-box protein [Pseudomonas sp. 2FG]